MIQPVRNVQPAHEHEFEVAPGLPEPLPPGERVLWQGAPDAGQLARRVFHVRGISVYFALALAARGLYVLQAEGGTWGQAAVAMLWLLPAAAFAVGTLAYLARLSAQTTLYTLTNRRLVMRIGIALTLTFNVPLRRVAGAALRLDEATGTGDIPLTLAGSDKIAYVHLWPHARPWRLARPEPMLRCVPDAQKVSRLLVQAWAHENGTEVTPPMTAPAPQAAPAAGQPQAQLA